MTPATETSAGRVRSRKPDHAEPTEPGRFYVELRRGRRYVIASPAGSPDLIFEKGVRVEVPEAVYDHLASSALDSVTARDPELGRCVRRFRKFHFSPPLPELVSEEFVDLEGEDDA